MTASACTLYELNACTFVKSLVLCFTYPFQIAFDRWLAYNVNTNSQWGQVAHGQSVQHLQQPYCPRMITNQHVIDIIENKNKKNLRNILKKQKTALYPMVIRVETIDGKLRQKLFKEFLGSYSSEHNKFPQNTQVHPHNWNTQNNLTLQDVNNF